MILEFGGHKPQIDKSAFIAEGSVIVGNVSIGKNVSVWFNATIRGDMDKIIIGDNSNIQDGSTVHNMKDIEVRIGKNVIVGHNCVLHSCEIGDGSLIGMGSIVLDRAKIGKNCLIGAGSVVTPGTVIPDNMLALGSPAKMKRELTAEEIANFQAGTHEYIELTKGY
jgi:carbonic anhydrase/acetyltransferase-like protein (isoleucine patch superfamily)